MACKLLAAWYLLLGMSATITGDTNAYFSDQKKIEGMIQAGNWETEEDPEKEANCSNKNEKHGNWDCSSLNFVKNQFGFEEENIFAVIKNSGEEMQTEGIYEIYYIEKGNPKKGELITEGKFNGLTKDGQIKLTFKPDKIGNYKFKAFQHPDHPGKGELWSDEIKVKVTLKDLDTGKLKQQEEKATEKETEVELPVEVDTSEEKQETIEPSKKEENLIPEETDPPIEDKSEQSVEVKKEKDEPKQVEKPLNEESEETIENNESLVGEKD